MSTFARIFEMTMTTKNKLTGVLRMVTGIIILLHGLFRIVFIGKYIDFVLENFSGAIPSHTALTVGAALFPFIEFFTGTLIMVNIGYKKSIVVGIMISLIMSAFIIAGDMYPRLIYHCIVFVLLSILYVRTTPSKPIRLLRRQS